MLMIAQQQHGDILSDSLNLGAWGGVLRIDLPGVHLAFGKGTSDRDIKI